MPASPTCEAVIKPESKCKMGVRFEIVHPPLPLPSWGDGSPSHVQIKSLEPPTLLEAPSNKKQSFFPGGSNSKASAYNAGHPGSIPGLGRSRGEGNGTPLQHSCLENPMDGGAWWAAVHGAIKRWTRLSGFTFTYFSD